MQGYVDLHLLIPVVELHLTIEVKTQPLWLIRVGLKTHGNDVDPRFKGLDRTAYVGADGNHQIIAALAGPVEVAQPQLRAALRAALAGVEQLFQMPFDSLDALAGLFRGSGRSITRRIRLQAFKQAVTAHLLGVQPTD